MSSYVTFQVRLSCETFSAVLTLKWSLFGVNSYVVDKVTIISKTYATIFTLKGFLSDVRLVSSQMTFEFTLQRKAFFAIIARIWFFFGMMSPYMVFEVRFPCKAFLTLLAMIWFLFGVSSYVILIATLTYTT